MILGVDFGREGTCAAVSINGNVFPLKPSGGWGYTLGQQEFAGERGAALHFYRELAESCFGEPVTQVRLACPPGCPQQMRQALLDVANRDGLPGTVVEAPLAAAFCFDRLYWFQNGEKVVVCDFGSGPFSAALVEKRAGTLVLSAWKEHEEAGGAVFRQNLQNELFKRLGVKYDLGGAQGQPDFQRLLGQESERILRRLSMEAEVTLSIPCGDGRVECAISRTDFNMMAGAGIWKTVRMIEGLAKDAGSALKLLDRVVCTGSCAQIPYVLEILERAAGKRALRLPDPKLAVCCGLAAGAW